MGCVGARVRGLRGGSGPAGWAGGGQLGHLAQQGGLSSLFLLVFFSGFVFSFLSIYFLFVFILLSFKFTFYLILK